MVRFVLFAFVINILSSLAMAGISCESIEIFNTKTNERIAICESIQFLNTEMTKYQFQIEDIKGIEKISLSNNLIYNPEAGAYDFGYFNKQNRTLDIVNFKTFDSYHKEKLGSSFERWQAYVVNKLMNYYTHINGNNSAMSFFQESASSYMEVKFLGIEKSLKLYNFPKETELCGYELSDALYAFDPIFYGLASWYWVKEEPRKRLSLIFSGDINLEYIYGTVVENCP